MQEGQTRLGEDLPHGLDTDKKDASSLQDCVSGLERFEHLCAFLLGLFLFLLLWPDQQEVEDDKDKDERQ